MKIWKISQTVDCGYDTFDSAVVIAATEEEARLMHPQDGGDITKADEFFSGWVFNPDDVIVELIGTAKPESKKGVVVASFNAA